MSDLNLDNIVSFKAVDKDGNEQNVTVDEMVEMVSTRMVMALSETSTFATAAATGDAAQMTMQSLASKLGGIKELLPLYPFISINPLLLSVASGRSPPRSESTYKNKSNLI